MSSNSSRDDVFLGGVRVLVVDDSGPVRGLMTEILEHYGATVTTVNSAYEALEILPHERPDVLVSDLEMPDKDGYWLIGQIRGLQPWRDRKSTRLNSSHLVISYAVFCLKKKKKHHDITTTIA